MFTLPEPLAAVALQNKTRVYGILFRRQLLGSPSALSLSVRTVSPTPDRMPIVRSHVGSRLCPACRQGQLIVINRLPPTPRSATVPDTS